MLKTANQMPNRAIQIAFRPTLKIMGKGPKNMNALNSNELFSSKNVAATIMVIPIKIMHARERFSFKRDLYWPSSGVERTSHTVRWLTSPPRKLVAHSS